MGANSGDIEPSVERKEVAEQRYRESYGRYVGWAMSTSITEYAISFTLLTMNTHPIHFEATTPRTASSVSRWSTARSRGDRRRHRDISQKAIATWAGTTSG